MMAHSHAHAQAISLTTIPLASGDQFAIFPSQNFGMGGVSFALEDGLLDPFVNPAKGVRSTNPLFAITPTVYSVDTRRGSVWTLPVAGITRTGDWFGGGAGALQTINVPRNRLAGEVSTTNKYAFISAGRVLSDKVAVGGSGYLSNLRAMDGSEWYFGEPFSVNQSGHTEQFRLGTLVQLDGTRFFETLLLLEQVNMTYDVTYREFVTDSLTGDEEVEFRDEHNVEATRTWGLHLAYQQPLGSHGWRVGAILTGNRKTHPKIPTYEINEVLARIPRDPGHTWAYDIGLGVSRTFGPPQARLAVGMDLAFEPAWSHTWAEAEAPVTTTSGQNIRVGGKTVENRFVFSNVKTRMGLTQHAGPVAFQMGLRVELTDYGLDQWNHVMESYRHQDQRWAEWTLTWGIAVGTRELRLHYQGAHRDGNYNPNVPDASRAVLATLSGSLIPPIPRITTHRLSIVLPIH
jgi:hypothetical protein